MLEPIPSSQNLSSYYSEIDSDEETFTPSSFSTTALATNNHSTSQLPQHSHSSGDSDGELSEEEKNVGMIVEGLRETHVELVKTQSIEALQRFTRSDSTHFSLDSTKTRQNLIDELLKSERAHLQSLDSLVESYIKPIRLESILPAHTDQEIFSNIELIRSWNATFLRSLDVHLSCGDSFADLFVEMSPLLRQLYTQYYENYFHALEAYRKSMLKKNFRTFIERKQKDIAENKTKNLLPLLFLPIQRTTAYRSFFSSILKKTERSPADRTFLQ
eukprot:TRINITY_DN417_c0_g3_i1.p1 TRINITY_DN417_c0_g3~~TRINITY_DN417_c0_g3_i1.p1  ORF type:complete len:281 (+),score=55.81 TRINITY_DN417_c0_g3_i1:25-843(+)